MKKTGILNSHIANVLSKMRHTDQLCIGDSGLPVPSGVLEIDISLKENFPDFITVLKIIFEDMYIEKAFIAEEILKENERMYLEIKKIIDEKKIVLVKHEVLKEMTRDTKAIIRTGEMSPYANIILQSNVNF